MSSSNKMQRSHSYDLLRAAVFILLPVFFYTRPMMPAPLQIQFLAFGASVLVAELLRLFVSDPVWLRRLYVLPLLAALGSVYPYRSQLAYFDTMHQGLIGLFIVLGLLYWVASRLSTR